MLIVYSHISNKCYSCFVVYSYPFTLRLLDLDYTDHLADASTPEYQELKKQLVDGVCYTELLIC